MTTYVVTSDLLSRPRGETFSDDELGDANVGALIAAGHLQEQTGPTATESKEKSDG